MEYAWLPSQDGLLQPEPFTATLLVATRRRLAVELSWGLVLIAWLYSPVEFLFRSLCLNKALRDGIFPISRPWFRAAFTHRLNLKHVLNVPLLS